MEPVFGSVDESHPEAWANGTYEMFIDFDGHDPARLRAGLNAMWSHPSLEGPYASDTRFADQEAVSPALVVNPGSYDVTHLYGRLTFEGGGSLPFGLWADCFDSGDALTIYIAEGALHQLGVDVWEDSSADSSLLAALERALADLGRAVFAVAPFWTAVIGHGGFVLTATEELQTGEDVRDFAYLVREDGQLRYSPVPWGEQAL